MSRVFIAFFFFALLVGGVYFFVAPHFFGGEKTAIVHIGGQIVRVDVSDTPELRTRGLSGREALEKGEGMLFIFPEDGLHSFWMKDMQFSIDIIWISSSGMIVDIRESVAPGSYPAVFTPRVEARYVVELPAGFATSHNVQVGDRVGLPIGI